LAPLLRAIGWDWKNVHVKGELVPARGRTPARLAQRHYASSNDPRHEDIQDIIPVIAHWLDEIESQASSMIALALTGTIEAVLWIAIFGDDEIATPDLPAELDTRARRVGVQILLENYTTPDPEDGNSTKLFLGTSRQR
jgi:hypothetical protein